jgi:glutamate dehydrogenase/leucine dehydrogenase
VAGAANTQLAGESVAAALRDRGIVWAPDFIINAGGLIAVADELDGFDADRVDRGIKAIGDTLLEVYDLARRESIDTLEAAKRVAGDRL